MNLRYSGLKLALIAGAATTVLAAPTAWAQTASASEAASVSTQDAPDKFGSVVVTARKRSEDALKIPIAITAVSGQAMEQHGLESIHDLANFTPGVTDLQAATGLQHAGRGFQTVIIRGMNPSFPGNPTTSIFLNGTPVSSADMITSLADVDHVEILKGPQSAYFGRATFAGAINVVSKAPTNHWTGDLQVEAGTRNTYMVQGDISGPIIPDKLMFTAGARYDRHDGSYQNADNPSQLLGNEETESYHAGLTAKPIDNLTIKAYGLLIEENDGPAGIGTYQAAAPSGNQNNCVVAGAPFICGTLPGLLYGVTPALNSTVTSGMAAFLANPGGIISGSQAPGGFGLKRQASHVDLTVDYVVPNLNLTFTNLFAFNQNRYGNLYDLTNLDTLATGPYLGHFPGGPAGGAPIVAGTGGGLPYFQEIANQNLSEEFRIATDASKPYRALIGYSYIKFDGNNASGFAIGAGSLNGKNNPTRTITEGFFFSLAYDITSKLTVNFDGRYQSDKEYSYTNAHALTDQINAYNFLPRVSAQYKFTPDMMAYATYSEAANPAVLNAFYVNLPAASKAAIVARGISAAAGTKPELITNYEAGVKGRFLDGRATVAADVYYDVWTNQINTGSYIFAATDPANPFNISGVGAGTPDPISFYSNNSSSVAKGFEFEGNLIPVDHVTLNLQLAYNDTQYTTYICTSCTPYTSTFDAKGKYLPNAPLFSTTIGGMYANTINIFARPMDWFVRADFIYRDGLWIDSANTARTPPSEILNVRGGVTLTKGLTLEGFVNNLTNNKSPTSGYAFVVGSGSSISVALPALITGGVKLGYQF